MNLFFASRRLKYFLLARHSKGHGIHSPFVFNLFSEIFLNKPDPGVVKTVVDLRQKLKHIQLEQEADLFRDGSLRIDNIPEKGRGREERISGYDKYCRLLALLAGKVNGLPVLQIGGGLSMASLAMLAGASGSKVILVNRIAEADGEGILGGRSAGEGTPDKESAGEGTANEVSEGGETSEEGMEREESAEALTSYKPGAVVAENMEMRLIDKYERLGNICFEEGKAGLILIVANRVMNKLLYCFDMLAGAVSDDTIIIIENIHLSADLENEWNRLISDRRVSISIDLLRYGLLFFRKGILKQHFLIRY